MSLEVPVEISNFELDGTFRVQLTPLMREPPGFGAILMSLLETPHVDMDITILGGAKVTSIPWLRQEIMGAILRSVQKELEWPNRVVIPSMPPDFNATVLSEEEIEDLSDVDMGDPIARINHNGTSSSTTSSKHPEKIVERKIVSLSVTNGSEGAFDALDKDDNGQISKKEFQEMIESEETIRVVNVHE